jgi:hypothetical protein
MDGRNECHANEHPTWEREAPTSLLLAFNYHGGSDSTWIALRDGKPVAVKTESDVHHFHGEEECHDDVDDFDRLERRLTTCGLSPTGDVATKADVRAALFKIDGAGGRYRRTLGGGETPGFDVAVHAARKQLAVEMTPTRPARAGEAFELWTVGSAGRPLAWTARFDGARWQLAGLKRAPRELPPIAGDAQRLQVPIVRRHVGEYGERTPLTVVAVSADGATRVATSDLGADDADTLGMAVSWPSVAARAE